MAASIGGRVFAGQRMQIFAFALTRIKASLAKPGNARDSE